MDTQDTSPAVLLFFDKRIFIFNVGEGLQRFCTEHKIKLSKIDYIFLSRICSETAGGIPGLLGMRDDVMSVNLWGSSDLQYLLAALKPFISLSSTSFGSEPVAQPETSKLAEPLVLINDEVVKISAILLKPGSSVGSAVKPGDASVVYLCELPEIVGKFDKKKAKSLGLEPGQKYGRLQSGKSVMLDDDEDTMIHPSDVMGPSIPGPIVVLVDCPTELHLQELLSIQSLNSYYTDFSGNPAESVKTVNCVIHLSPAAVTSSPSYQQWMEKFGPAQHIMAGHETKNAEIPIFNASAVMAARLNYLCPQFFPSPGFRSLEHLNNLTSDEGAITKSPQIISAENLLKFTLRPHAQLGLDKSNIPSVKTSSEVIDELRAKIPEIDAAAQNVRKFWHGHGETEGSITPVQDSRVVIEKLWLEEESLPCLDNIRRDDLEIVLLGTGSTRPSKYRNVSSVYINLFSKGSLILDCEEGNLGQLRRRYGMHGADAAVRNLRCVWISHVHHADHHTGLARVFALRRDLLKGIPHEPLLVVAPGQLESFLIQWQRFEDLDMEFLDCLSTTTSSCGVFRLKKLLSEAGLESLLSFPVWYCHESFGIALKAAERVNSKGKLIPGWKIVYSGHTRPCTEVVEASRGATVLIHEATFEDRLVEAAVAGNHSTIEEVVGVGNLAGAYRIVLTQFSQRYPKITAFHKAHMDKTCIAFDMMSINIADLPILPSVLPYLELLFKNEMTVSELHGVVGDVMAA